MTPKLLLALLALLSLNALAHSAKRATKEFTQIDKLRQTILRMDQENKEPRANTWRKETSYLDLIRTYKDLGDDIDRQFPVSLEAHLDVLNSLWLWARTQSELRSVDGIYMTFRKMQQDVLAQRTPFDVKQWTNFARTVLSDANAAVPPALERIADFIVNSKLFVSAWQVAEKLGLSLGR